MDFRFSSNENIYKTIGERVKNYRISMNLTQAQFGQKCGMPKRAVERIESGENRNLDNFLAVLRGFNLLANIDLLIPEQEERPTDIVAKKPIKKRVYPKKAGAEKPAVIWGDEE